MPTYRSVAPHPFNPTSGLNIAPGDLFDTDKTEGDRLVASRVAVEVVRPEPSKPTVPTPAPAADEQKEVA